MSDMLSVVVELRVLTEAKHQLFVALWPVRNDTEGTSALIHNKENEVAFIFLKLANCLTQDNLRNEILVLTANLCRTNSTFASAIAEQPEAKSFASSPLIASTPAHLMCVAYILYKLPAGTKMDDTTAQFLKFTLKTFESAQNDCARREELVMNVVHALTVFLRRSELRDAFRQVDGAPHLLTLINLYCSDMTGNTQFLYDCLFCAWLSLHHPDGLILLHKQKIIPIVHDVLKRCSKEKCLRIAVIIFKTILTMQKRFSDGLISSWSCHPALVAMNNGRGPRFFADLVGVGVLKTLTSLRKRTWGDDDILNVIEDLHSTLESNVEELTTFSEYVGEIHSGILEWSPTHTSTKFWKENLKNFEANEYEVLRDLACLVLRSRHDPTLAIACHDFGELVRYHPYGRKILSLVAFQGVKERIMELMGSQNQEVAHHALLSVQKIMVQRWEFLQVGN